MEAEECLTVDQLIKELGKIKDKDILVKVFDGMNPVEFNVLGVDADDDTCWISVEAE